MICPISIVKYRANAPNDAVGPYTRLAATCTFRKDWARHSKHRAVSQRASKTVSEICVCTNKTCRRQGSQQILRTLQDLELEYGVTGSRGITVRSSGKVLDISKHIPYTTFSDAIAFSNYLHFKIAGCQGGCGSGPNVILSPSGLRLLSVQTPATVFKLLREYCGIEISKELQKCVQIKAQATHLAQNGDLQTAQRLYLEALKIAPPHIAYKLHSNLSLVALSCGDIAGAEYEAKNALERAPKDFTTAKIRMIEACLAANKWNEAENYLNLALQEDRSFAATPLYKELSKRVMKCVSH